jgi:hypothetical protein
MKKILLFTSACILAFTSAKAQWCVPTTAIPYNSNMPGITHVVLNTIDRASADLEHYPSNSYVNTGMSTDLTPGQTYSISISFTIDASICPDMNLRVWIDYNHDYQLDDINETVVSANNRTPGTYTASFTVPADVTPGTTRMRVTAKMSPNGGHTLPTPCDNPADPFGYHGEIEDYDIIINSPTGIQEMIQKASYHSSLTDDLLNFSFNTTGTSITSLKLYDVTGRLSSDILPEQKTSSGDHHFDSNISKMQPGVYLAVLTCGNEKQVLRVVIP